MEPIVQFTKDRRNFWAELNQTRALGVPKIWREAFPEATNINFHTLLEANQYLTSVSNDDKILKGTAHLPGVEMDPVIKPYHIEYMENYERVDTETLFNASLFFSFSDGHHSVHMHRDYESVLLIQGYGEVTYITVSEDNSKKEVYTLKTGDAIFIPRLYGHKSVPMGPRVTLSLGANPTKAMSTNPNFMNQPVNTSQPYN
jgi:hypothetical protein|tara:strand:- start:1103 stop:1705 length:603 start_codon:yes stop_codon:yes gene_type:complete